MDILIGVLACYAFWKVYLLFQEAEESEEERKREVASRNICKTCGRKCQLWDKFCNRCGSDMR